MWINSQNLVVYNYIYEIRQSFPNVSFPEYPTDADFEVVGVFPVVQTPQPAHDPITQNLIQLPPEYVDGQWFQVWSVEPATPEEIAQRQDEARQSNKYQAESLLQKTDWTATVDIANPQYSNPCLMNQNEFLAYRSQVRQIALNPPITVEIWPIKPTEVWSS